MMDHLEAQSIVSEAMDREPVDAELLAAAKEHCRACPECSAFVSAQLAARRLPLPEAPADLADRVMAAVRAEAQADRAAGDVAAQAAAETAAAKAAKAAEPIATLAPPKRTARRQLKLPRPLVVGGIAAAMLVALVGAGTLVVIGSRQMSSPTRQIGKLTTTAQSAAEAPTLDYKPEKAPAAADSAGGATSSSKSTQYGAAGADADSKINPASELITVNGVVYMYTGPASVSVSTMQALGVTTSALDAKKTAIQRTVYQDPTGANTVYVEDDAKQVIAFGKVTRSYLGLTYQMMSSDLTAYGQFPNLPAGMTAPTSADGSPSFMYDGTDSSGIKVYRQSTAPSTQGIAVAPRSDASGPAAGDPYWTWWAPVR